MDILVLCGAEPSLLAVQKQLHVYWSQLITTLRNAASCYPRCVPLGVTFPPAVLAFCLVNIASQRCLSSLKPSAVSDALSTSLSAGEERERVLLVIESIPALVQVVLYRSNAYNYNLLFFLF